MGLTKEERDAIAESRIGKSLRAYGEAKGILPLQYWDAVANRLYYAAYNAVTAALIAHGDAPQTHSGAIHLFGLRFIKTGMLPPDIGRLYHSLFTLRQTGDYDDTFGLSEADVLPYVEPTGQFIETVIGLARQKISN